MKVTKITWRSVSCPLTDYFSNSIKFIYYQYYINQIAKNLSSLTLLIFEVFVLISLVINLSLNETLTIFLLYGKQNWMTQLILATSLWDTTFISFETFMLLTCKILKFMWRRGILLCMSFLLKTLRILIHVFEWLFSFHSVLCFFFGVRYRSLLCLQFLM